MKDSHTAHGLLQEAARILKDGVFDEFSSDTSIALYSSTGEQQWSRGSAAGLEGQLDGLAALSEEVNADSTARAFQLPDTSWAACMPVTTEFGLSGFLLATNGSDAAATSAALTAEGRLLNLALQVRHTALDMAGELSDRYEELNLVYDLSEALHLDRMKRAALDTLFEAIYDALNLDGICLAVPNMGRRSHYPPNDAPPTSVDTLLDILDRRVKETGQSAVVNYVAEDEQLGSYGDEVSHLIGTAIDVDGDPGILVVGRSDPDDRFYMCDVRLMASVARQVSIFLTNEKVEAARQQLFDSTIFGLARLAESRDKETGAHLERTSMYCRLIASHLLEQGTYAGAINQRFVDDIFRSSPLHDIGKVGVPDAILLKPGKLTAEEFDQMKTHTLIGGDTLRDIEDRLHWGEHTHLTLGRDIAYHHHEKWDGSGYPHGLAGEDIPLAARIMALADVFDALMSRRCYKDAFPAEKVRAIILEGRGRHFDPRIVDAFVVLEEELLAVAGRLADENNSE